MNTNKIGGSLEGFAEFSRKVAAEGTVLIKNEGQVLPLTKDDKISIFGRTQINYYRNGTGSGGSVNVEYTTNILEGFRNNETMHINEELASIYEAWVKENPFDNGGGGWAAEPWFQKEMPLTDEIVEAARKKSNKAVVVIGRTAGEDKDNLVIEGSYLLTQTEQEMLDLVTKYFEQVVVVLNVSNILDMSWMDKAYKNPIQSIIYVWQGGMEGGNAAIDVLSGAVTPSGKLTDTIAYAIEDYSSTANYGDLKKNQYQEDIYVGYRYFETFCPEKVRYEFGYGLSYTNFEMTNEAATVVTKEGKAYIKVTADIKNIGDTYTGKEVCQVYFSAPQGKLGKPAKVLAGFAKTNALRPGETQTVTVEFPVSQMASYDDSGVTGHRFAYVLEAGEYVIYVGNSVRKVKPVKVDNKDAYVVENTKVVEQLEQALAPKEAFKRMKPGEKKADGTYELVYEDVPVREYSIKERIEARLPKNLEVTGDKGYKLRDVYDKKVSMEAFISQLTAEELATIVRGEGMSSPLATPGTASAFGGVSEKLVEYGIPVAATADGPSGIRMESGRSATQIPIGTLLAATWDAPLVEALYEMEGKELAKNEIDLLLGPGMNIRRNPLNGRNFEYYSEDPLITGVFGTAATVGIHKGGAHATLKHFASNNQETNRFHVESVVSERALREIYLKGFEMAVKEGHARSIMTTYNPLNGYWTSSNYDLCTTILRKEWGFDGFVMSDWWALINNVIDGGEPDNRYMASMVRAQNDVYMVVNNFGAEVNVYGDNTLDELEKGNLQIGELQRAAANICNFLMEAPVFFRKQTFKKGVRSFKALQETINENTHELGATTKIEITNMAEDLVLHVTKAGVYTLMAEIFVPGTEAAQVACNMNLNDELVLTIQRNGTCGKNVIHKLIKMQLEEGCYRLRFKEVKPTVIVNWLEFIAE